MILTKAPWEQTKAMNHNSAQSRLAPGSWPGVGKEGAPIPRKESVSGQVKAAEHSEKSIGCRLWTRV